MSTLPTKKRALRVRSHLGTGLPRLSVFRSNRHIWAQIIDDKKGRTLASFSSKKLESKSGTKKDIAYQVGEKLGGIATAAKIKSVVFDRGSYKYHGRVKMLAEGAKKRGLKF